jgi:hypothetical protein
VAWRHRPHAANPELITPRITIRGLRYRYAPVAVIAMGGLALYVGYAGYKSLS